MMGLWADGWFYISSAGLLVSGILFFFLLGQYRVASEAADVSEGEQGADKEAVVATATVRPVYIPEEAPAPRVASHPLPEPEPKPKPLPQSDFMGPERRKDPATTTGGISPAVVYLQNIKGELAELHKDLRSLAKRVDDELASVSTRDEALIARLGELTQAVEGMKAAAAAPAAALAPVEAAPAPAPKKARKAEKAPEPEKDPEPEPAVIVIDVAPPPSAAVAPEMKTEPVPSSDETIRMELGALISQKASPETAEPVPAQSEPAPADAATPNPAPPPEEKPRRGPVWPV